MLLLFYKFATTHNIISSFSLIYQIDFVLVEDDVLDTIAADESTAMLTKAGI